MQLADTLSRPYLPDRKETLVEDLQVNELRLSLHLPMPTKSTMQSFKGPLLRITSCSFLFDTVLAGWPTEKAQLQTLLVQNLLIKSTDKYKALLSYLT